MIMNTQSLFYRPNNIRFYKAYLVQMRPYLLFVSGAAGLTGIAVAFAEGYPGWKAILAFIPFFFGYGFGQALTDCFQTDTDSISAPYRPLSKKIIGIPAVLTVSITGLISCGIILLYLNSQSFFLCLVSVFGLATYSYIKKHFWYAGPFYNAWIVALLPIMGYLAVSGNSITSLPPIVWSVALLSFFSYSNFVLIGYLKDISADRSTGYRTFPVVFGWIKTVLAGDVIALASIISFLLIYKAGDAHILVAVLAIGIIVFGQLYAHFTRTRDEKTALLPILATVRGFILLQLTLVISFVPGWLIHSILFYLVFEVILLFRPSKYQV